MTSKLTYWGTLGVAAASVVVAGPAYAAGTTAGVSITNTATVNYQVSGVAQNSQSASDTFVVDRVINLTVIDLDGTTTNVVPGQTNAVTTFRLTNISNETLDFALAVTQPSGGAGGRASDIEIQAHEIVKMRERLAQVISKATGQDVERVRQDIDRDYWMTTDEAKAYGILGKVISKASEVKF